LSLTLFFHKSQAQKIDSLFFETEENYVFEENKGQWPSSILFKSLLQEGGNLFLEKNKLIFRFETLANSTSALSHCPEHNDHQIIKGHVYFLEFLNSAPTVEIEKKEKVNFYKNYFVGNDPQNWASHVNSYKKIIYKNLYPGIDLKLYQSNKALKYDFIVSPGAPTDNIRLQYTGIDKLEIDPAGNLILSTSINQIMELSPIAYQIIEGKPQNVSCSFRIIDANKVTFDFPQGYNTALPLIIDPQLVFSTFSGASAPLTINLAYTSTFGSDSSLFTGSIADNRGIPTTPGAYQVNYRGGGYDIVLYKFNAQGTRLVWATYIGGNSLGSTQEYPLSLITDAQDNLYLLGATVETNFPVTVRAAQANNAGRLDFIISKLSQDGSRLLASTYLGGANEDGAANQNAPTALFYTDHTRGEINLDKQGNVVIIGSSNSPILARSNASFSNSNRGGHDVVLAKLNANLDSLHWTAFLGGSNHDAGYGIRINKNNDILAIGGTTSNDFPTTPNTWQPNFQGGDADGFVSVIKSDGSRILHSSYIGTRSFDQVLVLDLDKEDNIYIAGQTRGTFPVFPAGIYNNPNSGQFIVKLPPNLSSPYFSSRFGSQNNDIDITLSAMLVDVCENIYLSGWGGFRSSTTKYEGSTANLPYTQDPFNVRHDKSNYYLVAFSANMQTLSFATFIGNKNIDEHQHGGTNRFDKNGIIYQSSCLCLVNTNNITDLFPTTPGAFSRNWQQGVRCLTGAFKFDFDLLVKAEAKFKIAEACDKIEFKNQSKSGKEFKWYFGDGDSSLAQEPGIHHFKAPGIYTVTLIAINREKCNISDTIQLTVAVPPIIKPGFIAPDSVCGLSLTITDTSQNAANIIWDMGDGTILKNPGSSFTHLYARSGEYVITQYLDTASYCGKTFSRKIHLQAPPQPNFDFSLTDSCGGIQITPKSLHSTGAVWQVYNGQFFEPFDPNQYRFPQKGEKFIKLKVKGIPSCNYQDSIIKKVIIPQNKAIANFWVAEKICGDQILIIDKSQGGNLYQYAINDSIAYSGKRDTLIHTISKYGKYKVKLTIDEGDICGDTLVKETTLNPIPKVVIRREPQICILDQKFNAEIEGADTWKWTFSNGESSQEPQPLVRFKNGLQSVQIFVSNSQTGCKAQKSETFQLENKAKAIFKVASSCERKIPLISQSIDAFSYRWLIGNPILAFYTQKDTFHVFEKAGRYPILHIINENTACVDSALRHIDIYELPKAEFEILETPCALFTTLKARTSSNIEKVSWHINNRLEKENQAQLELELKEGANLIKNVVTNKWGCKDSIEKQFNFEKQNRAWFEIPNVFTPNNDGINDFFEINVLRPDALNCIEDVQIYDRWGNIVFQALSPPFKWDGNYNGAPAKEGAYFYLILFQHNGRRSYRSGIVTVIR
jgi:gliding motility-associated-like protein